MTVKNRTYYVVPGLQPGDLFFSERYRYLFSTDLFRSQALKLFVHNIFIDIYND